MTKIFRLFVCCELLMTVGVACESTNIKTPTPVFATEISLNWWTTWLAQPVCDPPCWQHITPGLTTLDEAVSILENMSEIVITFKSENAIDWEFTKDEGGTLTVRQDGIVNTIWIGSVSDQKLFLNTIVASYGDPQYVKPYDCREGMCSTALVYPDLGMLLSIFIENEGIDKEAPEIEVLPDTVINRVYFIEPGIESFLDLYRFPESELLMDWTGYGEYP